MKNQTVTIKGKSKYKEALDVPRLKQLKRCLRNIDFSYTIFFQDETGNSVRLYQGATFVEPAV